MNKSASFYFINQNEDNIETFHIKKHILLEKTFSDTDPISDEGFIHHIENQIRALFSALAFNDSPFFNHNPSRIT